LVCLAGENPAWESWQCSAGVYQGRTSGGGVLGLVVLTFPHFVPSVYVKGGPNFFGLNCIAWRILRVHSLNFSWCFLHATTGISPSMSMVISNTRYWAERSDDVCCEEHSKWRVWGVRPLRQGLISVRLVTSPRVEFSAIEFD